MSFTAFSALIAALQKEQVLAFISPKHFLYQVNFFLLLFYHNAQWIPHLLYLSHYNIACYHHISSFYGELAVHSMIQSWFIAFISCDVPNKVPPREIRNWWKGTTSHEGTKKHGNVHEDSFVKSLGIATVHCCSMKSLSVGCSKWFQHKIYQNGFLNMLQLVRSWSPPPLQY